MTAGCIPDKILIKDDTYCAIFVSASPKADCYTAVFSVVTQCGGAVRDDTKNAAD